MLQFFYILALIILPLITQGSPIIAARVRVQQSAITTLSDISRKVGAPAFDKLHISQIDAFLITDEAKTLHPVVFVKGDDQLAKNIPLMGALVGLQFTPPAENDGWFMGTLKGPALSPDTLELLRGRLADKAEFPLLAWVEPPTLLAAIRNDASFESKIKGTPMAAAFDELATLQSLELRLITTPATLRTVLILRAKEDTPLYTFFSQRLPGTLPEEHSRFGTDNTLFYGYSVYNAKISTDYLTHLATLFKDAAPQTSAKITDAAQLLTHSGGYTAFSGTSATGLPQVFVYGNWSPNTAPDFIKAQYAIIAAWAADSQQATPGSKAPPCPMPPLSSKKPLI